MQMGVLPALSWKWSWTRLKNKQTTEQKAFTLLLLMCYITMGSFLPFGVYI